MNIYKGITFAEGYNRSFAEFKEEFGSTHVFNEIHPDKREPELKKAFKIATDGNSSGTINKSKEVTAKPVRK